MHISKNAVLLLLSCLLSACANTSSQFSDQTNEKILQSSSNYPKLVEFYKNKLIDKESPDYRIKLIKTYERVGDYSSAIFYLQPLLAKSNTINFEINMLAGKAYLNQSDYPKAQLYLATAHQQQPNDANVLNLLGVLSSYQGNLAGAKNWFIAARNAMGDDRTVKNNLALVALLQGDYNNARELFESLLANKTSLNPQVKANLAIVYAKLGDENAFNRLVNEPDQIKQQQLYQQLSDLKLVDIRDLALVSQYSSNGEIQ